MALGRRAMELLAQCGVERPVDVAVDERPKARRQIRGFQAERHVVQIAQADELDELAAHGGVEELGYAARCLGKARVHRARGGLHALALDLLGVTREHQVVLVHLGRVGHKGAASALGAHQTLIHQYLKRMAHGTAREPRPVHELHLGWQLVSACVDASGDAVAQRARQALVLGQVLFRRSAHATNLYLTCMLTEPSMYLIREQNRW